MKKSQFLIYIIFITSSSCNHNVNNKNNTTTEVDKVTNTKPFETIKENATTDVTIGLQTWSSKNLDVERYSNGDIIPQIQNPDEWISLKSGAWCYYENNTSYGEKFGKMYNGFAVNDARGLAPYGYHVASTKEWFQLIDYLGKSNIAGEKIKSRESWLVTQDGVNGNGTNESGFNAFAGGYRDDYYFEFLGSNTRFWTSTHEDMWISYGKTNSINDCIILNKDSRVGYAYVNSFGAYYVRCIKN